MQRIDRLWLQAAVLAALLAPLWPYSLAAADEEPERSAVVADGRAPLPVVQPSAADGLGHYIDGAVASFRQQHGLPALSVSVVHDDALIWARGYGMADIAEARPAAAAQTLFRIGSVSKTFIWTAVMMLAERGQIDLDADVNRYLKTVRVADAFDAPVTMRHLMHHRAGFEDSYRLYAVGDDDPRSLAELLGAHQPARVYPPGARTSYSNWGAALAAQIVADISGRDYGDFLGAEILQPLGMYATRFDAPAQMDPASRALLATGYQDRSGALALQGYMQIGAYWPSGGMASTATDMARWMRFHLNRGELEGVRLLSARTHEQMWTRGFKDRPEAPDLAHGFQDRWYRGLRLLGHGGATAAFYTNMVLVPELGLGIYVSQNSRQTRVPVSQLPELIVDQLRGRPFAPELAADKGDPGALAEVTGTYLQNRRVFSSVTAVMGMSATATVIPVAADTLVLTMSGQSRQFRRVGDQPDLFEAADGARIAFVRDGAAVVALADPAGIHTWERVSIFGNPSTTLGAIGSALLLSLTTLIGFVCRLGRDGAGGSGLAARVASAVSLSSALLTVAFVAALWQLAAALQALDLSRLAEHYPPTAVYAAHVGAWLMCLAAVAALVAMPLAWRAEGWGLWRRLNFSAYALALLATALGLWQWRLVGAPLH